MTLLLIFYISNGLLFSAPLEMDYLPLHDFGEDFQFISVLLCYHVRVQIFISGLRRVPVYFGHVALRSQGLYSLAIRLLFSYTGPPMRPKLLHRP